MRLREFVSGAWPIIEPGMRFLPNWHVDCVCDHLEAVTRGDIRNLLINIPPGHAKSVLVSVMWPAWVWTFWPEWRTLTSSYDLSLTTRDASKARDIMTDNWYAETFDPAWRFKGDQNAKTFYKNTRAGFRFCHTVAGRGTGHRGDAIVCDDPLNAKDRHSEKKRASAIDWWDKTMPTRLNDPRTGAKVVIMQRLHEEDLSGHILQLGGYQHLCLPSEFEPERRSHTFLIDKTPFWEDPREEAGDLLFPELFTEEVLGALKLTLGEADFAGQHQQLPYPPGGAFFDKAWFKTLPAAPICPRYVRYWDLAGAKPNKGDWTVGVLMGITPDKRFVIVDIQRFQKASGERDSTILQTAQNDRREYGGKVKTFIEQAPGLAKEPTEALVLLLAGYAVEADPAHRDKITRAEPYKSQAQAGNVDIVEGDNVKAFLDIHQSFPFGSHDDDVDAAAGAFKKLTQPSRDLLNNILPSNRFASTPRV